MSYYTNPHGHQCPWYPYSELLGYPSANWCEQTSCFWISEPVSTYSSMAFILVASLLFSTLKRKNHPDLKLYLNLLLLIGVGSALYHISLNYVAQLLAHGLIYAFLGAIFLKNLMRQGRVSYSKRNKYLAAHVAVFLLIEHILYVNFLATQVLIPVVLALVIISEFMSKKYEEIRPHFKYLFASLFVLLLAEASSMMDLFRIHCEPKNPYFHGHALWHVLAAISFGLAYLHIFQLYPEAEDEQEIDFDKFTQTEDDSAAYAQAEEEEEEDEEDTSTEPSIQFDSMLDLNEDPELDEENSFDEEEEEDSAQIQFNFDEPESLDGESVSNDESDEDEDKNS